MFRIRYLPFTLIKCDPAMFLTSFVMQISSLCARKTILDDLFESTGITSVRIPRNVFVVLYAHVHLQLSHSMSCESPSYLLSNVWSYWPWQNLYPCILAYSLGEKINMPLQTYQVGRSSWLVRCKCKLQHICIFVLTAKSRPALVLCITTTPVLQHPLGWYSS